jgi:polyisoprenoid-binding protein YceI
MTTITETQTALPTGTWTVDPVHSQVGFSVGYLVGTFRGSFSPVEGTLTVAGDGSSELEGSTRVASVKVQDSSLAAHLLSPEFFDAERTPTISFSATGLRRSGDALAVDGGLTIKGVTRPVELAGTIGDPIQDAYGTDRIGVTLATTIDRTQFGLDWNLPLPSGGPALANDVTIAAELYLVRA